MLSRRGQWEVKYQAQVEDLEGEFLYRQINLHKTLLNLAYF